MKRTFSVLAAQILVVTVVTVVTVATAGAQSQDPGPTGQARPYRGLFGGGTSDLEQSLALRISLQEGYNQNVLADSDPAVPLQGPAIRGGAFTSGRVGLTYGLSRPRIGLFTDVGSGARYNPRVGRITGVHHQLALRSTIQLARATSLSLMQTVRYLPYYVFSLLPVTAGLDPTDLDPTDQGVSANGNVAWNGNLAINQQLGRRTSLSGAAGIANTYFRGAALDMRSAQASVRFSHGLTRYSSLNLGYGHREARYPGPGRGRLVNRNIEAGLGYARPLSLSRKTSASFGFGTTLYDGVQGTVYRATGNATLHREIAQTWSASLAYRRGVGFLEGISEPYFADSARLTVSGLIGDRVETILAANYSTGDLGAVLQRNPFTTYSGTVSFRYGLTRLLGISAQYGYYRHDFQGAVLLPQGVIPLLGRHTVRAGLSVWLPLLTRTRR
jgi:hypothetical protein